MTQQWRDFSQYLERVIASSLTIEPPLPHIDVHGHSPQYHQSGGQQGKQEENFSSRKVLAPRVLMTESWSSFPVLSKLQNYRHQNAGHMKDTLWTRAVEHVQQLPESLQHLWRDYLWIEQQNILPYFLRAARECIQSQLSDLVFAAYMYNEIRAEAARLEQLSTDTSCCQYPASPCEKESPVISCCNDIDPQDVQQRLQQLYDTCQAWYQKWIQAKGVSSGVTSNYEDFATQPDIVGRQNQVQSSFHPSVMPSEGYAGENTDSSLLALYWKQLHARLESRFGEENGMVPQNKAAEKKAMCDPYAPESLEFLHELRQIAELYPVSETSSTLMSPPPPFVNADNTWDETTPKGMEDDRYTGAFHSKEINQLMNDVFAVQMGAFVTHYQWYASAYSARVVKPWRDTQRALGQRSAQRAESWCYVQTVLRQQALFQDEKYKQQWQQIASEEGGSNSVRSHQVKERLQRLVHYVTMYFRADLEWDLTRLIDDWTQQFRQRAEENEWNWALLLLGERQNDSAYARDQSNHVMYPVHRQRDGHDVDYAPYTHYVAESEEQNRDTPTTRTTTPTATPKEERVQNSPGNNITVPSSRKKDESSRKRLGFIPSSSSIPQQGNSLLPRSTNIQSSVSSTPLAVTTAAKAAIEGGEKENRGISSTKFYDASQTARKGTHPASSYTKSTPVTQSVQNSTASTRPSVPFRNRLPARAREKNSHKSYKKVSSQTKNTGEHTKKEHRGDMLSHSRREETPRHSLPYSSSSMNTDHHRNLLETDNENSQRGVVSFHGYQTQEDNSSSTISTGDDRDVAADQE